MNFFKFLFGWAIRDLWFACATFAVVNRTATEITNRDATPQILQDPGPFGANRRLKWGLVTSVTGDSATSTYRFFTLPSTAVLDSLVIWCAAQGASAAFDVGLWQTTQNGGATASTQLFAAALSVVSAITGAGTELRFSAPAITTAGQALWQLLGLSVDSNIFYDVVVNVNVAVASGGAVVLKATYGL